ncbi:tetratricopeptide repeat protein [Limibacillus halophilus]|jgi:Flp pilus assembly protein TadD
MLRKPLLAGTAALLLLAAGPALADFTGGASDPLSDLRDQIEAGKYESAIAELQGIAAKDPQDADVFNLLGYATRKTGAYQESYDYYQQALAIDPEHKETLEYLGELYLQTDRLTEAEETLERLSEVCGFFGCSEKNELKAAIEAYKAGNKSSANW